MGFLLRLVVPPGTVGSWRLSDSPRVAARV
jgi:hypothetical protein